MSSISTLHPTKHGLRCSHILAVLVLCLGGGHLQQAAAADDTLQITRRTAFPIRLTVSDLSRIASASFWLTDDRGKRWIKVFETPIPPNATKAPAWMFRAPRDGIYGFKTATISRDSSAEAVPVSGKTIPRPEQMVIIDTTAPKILSFTPEAPTVDDPGRARVAWKCSDKYLSAAPTGIQLRDADGSWKLIASNLGPSGSTMVNVVPSDRIRLLVIDRAGNQTSSVPWTVPSPTLAAGGITKVADVQPMTLKGPSNDDQQALADAIASLPNIDETTKGDSFALAKVDKNKQDSTAKTHTVPPQAGTAQAEKPPTQEPKHSPAAADTNQQAAPRTQNKQDTHNQEDAGQADPAKTKNTADQADSLAIADGDSPSDIARKLHAKTMREAKHKPAAAARRHPQPPPGHQDIIAPHAGTWTPPKTKTVQVERQVEVIGAAPRKFSEPTRGDSSQRYTPDKNYQALPPQTPGNAIVGSTAATLLAEARQARSAGNTSKALELYRRLINSTEAEQAYVEGVRLLQQLDRQHEAIAWFKHVPPEAESDALRCLAARCYLDLKRYREAESSVLGIRADGPHYREGQFLSARAMIGQGKRQTARSILTYLAKRDDHWGKAAKQVLQP